MTQETIETLITAIEAIEKRGRQLDMEIYFTERESEANSLFAEIRGLKTSWEILMNMLPDETTDKMLDFMDSITPYDIAYPKTS